MRVHCLVSDSSIVILLPRIPFCLPVMSHSLLRRALTQPVTFQKIPRDSPSLAHPAYTQTTLSDVAASVFYLAYNGSNLPIPSRGLVYAAWMLCRARLCAHGPFNMLIYVCLYSLIFIYTRLVTFALCGINSLTTFYTLLSSLFQRAHVALKVISLAQVVPGPV